MKKRGKGYQTPLLMIFLSLALGSAPVISVLLSIAIAEIGNCTLHEGSINSCQIGSFELGETLYTMFVLGWFMLYSIPLGFLGLFVGLIWLAVRFLRNLSQR